MLFFVLSFSLSSDTNGIFSKYYNENIIVLDASGSSRQYINRTMQYTKPEYAIYPWNKDYDWCSNCGRSYEEHPWITFSLDKRKIKFNGYFVKSGCCRKESCCCEEDYYYCIECCLYSWSLQISDDNVTWTEIHKIEKDREMRRCKEKTYKFDKSYTTKYVRLIQNEACPGDPPCIALNKFELFGDVVGDDFSDDFSSLDNEEDDVSIIGHISKHGKVIEAQ